MLGRGQLPSNSKDQRTQGTGQTRTGQISSLPVAVPGQEGKLAFQKSVTVELKSGAADDKRETGGFEREVQDDAGSNPKEEVQTPYQENRPNLNCKDSDNPNA